jgi:hypothetical protein
MIFALESVDDCGLLRIDYGLGHNADCLLGRNNIIVSTVDAFKLA